MIFVQVMTEYVFFRNIFLGFFSFLLFSFSSPFRAVKTFTFLGPFLWKAPSLRTFAVESLCVKIVFYSISYSEK